MTDSKRTWIFCFLVAIALGAVRSTAADWKPVQGHLTTAWTDKVDPACPLPEYPRPQLVRPLWSNLNGLWDYAITKLDAPQPNRFEGKILVPFCVESALSGVQRSVTPNDRLWYRRTFAAPDLSGRKRLLLHFGAVDWEAKVSLNGTPVASHRGGYDAFTIDVTDALKPGENELLVSVFDATGGSQAKGKQSLAAIAKPHSIMYTPCSGIWQTVWLETVPANHIDALRIVPDVDAGAVSITVCGGSGTARIAVLDGGRNVVEGEGKTGAAIVLRIPQPRLWSPDSPFLYDLSVTLGDDKVQSYFGMRQIALGKDAAGVLRLMLNHQFVFQAGPLDQGFWPDGIYTAPTDEALKFDIEITKRLGFNMTRKHVKVEPARWYYWCDKLGLLVWQDMPAGQAGSGAKRDKATGRSHDGTPVSPAAARQHEAELQALVQQHGNSPAIVMWIVFNEGWGQYDTPRLTNWVKQLDPSRLVSNTSGWVDIKAGNIVDMHLYPGPGAPKPEADRAAVLGEFGGLGLAMPGHMWVDKAWGYRTMEDRAALADRYCDLWKKVAILRDEPGLSAAVYTQLTDVETESNGLLTYDRRVIKIDVAKAAAAVTASRGTQAK